MMPRPRRQSLETETLESRYREETKTSVTLTPDLETFGRAVTIRGGSVSVFYVGVGFRFFDWFL